MHFAPTVVTKINHRVPVHDVHTAGGGVFVAVPTRVGSMPGRGMNAPSIPVGEHKTRDPGSAALLFGTRRVGDPGAIDVDARAGECARRRCRRRLRRSIDLIATPRPAKPTANVRTQSKRSRPAGRRIRARRRSAAPLDTCRARTHVRTHARAHVRSYEGTQVKPFTSTRAHARTPKAPTSNHPRTHALTHARTQVDPFTHERTSARTRAPHTRTHAHT